jgi:Mitochondrial ribosomal protein subunit
MPPKVSRNVDWHRAAESVLGQLPDSPSVRSQHKSFPDIFRGSRVATIPKGSGEPPFFMSRHNELFPRHQILSSFNSAHRRGDWGLKRPLPPMKSPNIIVTEIDTQERQTPYSFAAEKIRFVRRMREFGLELKVRTTDANVAQSPKYFLSERQSRRPRSPLDHFHPQWNRNTGSETGPWILGLKSKEFSRFLRTVSDKRAELQATRIRLGISDWQSDRAKELVQACLDIPTFQPAYLTHATAGLTYSASGSMPSPLARAPPRRGRVNRGRSGTPSSALTHGIVARIENSRTQMLPNRDQPVTVQPVSATIARSGRLEVSVSIESGPNPVKSRGFYRDTDKY